MKGIIVIFVFVGALMSIQFFAFPMIKEVREQWDDIAQMKTILDNAERTKEDRIQYLDRLANVSEDDLRKLSFLVPSQVASEDLYVFLNELVRGSGLKADSITITDIGGKAADKQAQKALIFDIDVAGSYSNMRDLLAAIESNLRLMDVDSLKISRAQGADQPRSFYQLTLKGKFYYAGN